MTDNDEIIVQENAGVAVERTVVFFSEPRAATLLLGETIAQLIDAHGIQRGIVDLSTVPGIAIANALAVAGIPFESLVFGQTEHFDAGPTDEHPVFAQAVAEAMRLAELAERVTEVNVGELGAIDANVVLVPAMVDDQSSVIDFRQGSVLGAVLTQLEQAGRDAIVVTPPERGLRRVSDGSYVRTTFRVSSEPQGS